MREPTVVITKKILKLIAELDEFKGAWKAIGNLAPDRLNALKKIATIESIGSSTRIEGVKLSNTEIEALLSGIDIKSFQSRDEEEVAGYSEAMSMVFESFQEISISENHIKQLHSVLLKHSSKDSRHRGDYKKATNHVEAFDVDGKSIGVVFKTAAPFDTPLKMQALTEWTYLNIEKNELHPLLVIAIFTIHFLAIHPFQDGNGRLSRVITTLLLLKTGYLYVPYCSLERIIEMNKDSYYKALRKAQTKIETDDSGLEAWLMFFLESLKKQKDNLEKKIERENIMTKLPVLSKKIISIVKEHGHTTISDVVNITNTSRNTIKVRLKELVLENYLTRNGRGKSTWYTIGTRPV